ncbi:MAG: 50S ribosomal protein L18 [Candidatus Norongarragalinales archaeon]
MTKATGPLYVVHFRRRRENKTDYEKRFALLKSGKTRLVVRKSNKFVYAQFCDFREAGDCVVASACSRELRGFGFPGKSNSPSAYLTGFLAAKRAAARGVREFVLDIGLQAASKGAVVFAALKGAVDAGLNASFSPEKIPSEERIAGKHLSEETQKKFIEAKTKIESASAAQLAQPRARKF